MSIAHRNSKGLNDVQKKSCNRWWAVQVKRVSVRTQRPVDSMCSPRNWTLTCWAKSWRSSNRSRTGLVYSPQQETNNRSSSTTLLRWNRHPTLHKGQVSITNSKPSRRQDKTSTATMTLSSLWIVKTSIQIHSNKLHSHNVSSLLPSMTTCSTSSTKLSRAINMHLQHRFKA